MAFCLVCHGLGHHDFRDLDAHLAEHLTDAQLAQVPKTNWMAIVECDECEGTGVISDDRYADLMAAARAHVDQALAKLDEQEREDRRRQHQQAEQ